MKNNLFQLWRLGNRVLVLGFLALLLTSVVRAQESSTATSNGATNSVVADVSPNAGATSNDVSPDAGATPDDVEASSDVAASNDVDASTGAATTTDETSPTNTQSSTESDAGNSAATVGDATAATTDNATTQNDVAPPARPEIGTTGAGAVSGHTATTGEHATGGHASGDASEKAGTFDPHAGTWVNGLTRMFTGEDTPKIEGHHGEHHVVNIKSIRYDYLVLALLVMLGLGSLATIGARKAHIRPSGKASSLPNMVEAAADGFRDYLVGIMGRDMAMKYAPLIASFFFSILFMNWLGLVPGMLAPTSNPNVPIALALVAFIAVHVIAIKEAGVKSWFMHFVGEPIWLAPLNFPLHMIGELIKPLSLAMRLLCNVFGEEMVIATLTGLAITVLPDWLPIPFQLPMLFLGTFFGALQALVFSTLLAIYIAILSTHHDDHDEHNIHGHVEHTQVGGRETIVGHPSEMSLAMTAHPTESPVA
jgi:F-type H+-transporting ATPase subunit a